MKVGDIVTIYEDPITKTKPEGEAQVKLIEHEDGDFYYCEVKFPGDGPQTRYARRISKDSEL